MAKYQEKGCTVDTLGWLFPLFILTTGQDNVKKEGLKAWLPFDNLGRDNGLKLLSIATSYEILMNSYDTLTIQSG